MLSKVSLGISVILVACVVYLFTQKGQGSQDSHDMVDHHDGAIEQDRDLGRAGVPTVAFILEDSILTQYQYVIDEAPLLEDRSQAAARRYNREMEQYQNEMAKWQDYLSQPGATAEDQEKAMNDMAIREQKIQNMQYEIEKLQLDFNSEVFTYVTECVERYAKENDIDVVMNKNVQLASILYSNESFDITSQVVSILNAEYAADNKVEE
jgi:Skp family chaperone for outer membrane proteins